MAIFRLYWSPKEDEDIKNINNIESKSVLKKELRLKGDI